MKWLYFIQKGQYGPGEFLNLTQKWRFGWLKLETGRPEMKKEKHKMFGSSGRVDLFSRRDRFGESESRKLHQMVTYSGKARVGELVCLEYQGH
jgi:hypothetical protein